MTKPKTLSRVLLAVVAVTAACAFVLGADPVLVSQQLVNSAFGEDAMDSFTQRVLGPLQAIRFHNGFTPISSVIVTACLVIAGSPGLRWKASLAWLWPLRFLVANSTSAAVALFDPVVWHVACSRFGTASPYASLTSAAFASALGHAISVALVAMLCRSYWIGLGLALLAAGVLGVELAWAIGIEIPFDPTLSPFRYAHQALFAVVLLLWSVHRRRTSARRGACQTCGHDVRVSSSGVCPECGAPVRAA